MAVFGKLFGSKQKDDKLVDENFIENITKSIENKPFGVSSQNVIFGGIVELGGYYFFKTLIVGTFKIKTKNGAKLEVNGNGFELSLNSDMQEFESNPFNIKKTYITSIDFEIDEADISKIETSKVENLSLVTKKNEILFDVKND